ncbi:MAG: ATP-binding protein [Minwuia sp.]|nr:ATP-binding protein [Minwuia sp.]
MAAHPLASAALFLVTGVILTGILTWQVLDNLRTRTAVETARSYAASLGIVREYYTNEVVPKAREAGATVRHDYRDVPGAIPMPATVSIELGQLIDRAGSPARMRFYSAWPYPYREDGGPRDTFEQQAVDTFQTSESQPIIEVNGTLTGGALRYAEPVVMRAGCASCHNDDPLSPKRDWVAGDVGGVQAVTVALPSLLPGFGSGAIRPDLATSLTVAGLIGGLIGVTVLLFVLLRRLNRSLQLAASRNAKLTVAREAAEQANAGKNRIMSNISHELRTPLNAIIGFSEMISREALGSVGNPRYRDYATDIRDSGERLLSIIENMVSFAEIDSGQVSLTDAEIELSAELERVRSMMAPLSTEHPHPISIMIPPAFPALRMDRRALRNILANLLANAVQYSGKGAEIWLIASHHADGVTIEVRDNGVGIPPGDLKRIMQPFERAGDPSFANVEGIGLGLSIAQEMAALHGAGITLESTPQKGTVASLNVPRTRVVTDRTADRSDNGETRLARASTRA